MPVCLKIAARSFRPPERAAEIAFEHCRPTEDFHWYKVGKDVGNVRNQRARMIESTEEELKVEGGQ